MLHITKNPCPKDIEEDIVRRISDERWPRIHEIPSSSEANEIRRDYFDKLNKSRIRESLIAEQHGLCAYCMKRITNDPKVTRIEHFYPLSKSKSRAMDYQNMLGACNGGEHGTVTCCDKSKENTVLSYVSPFNQDFVDNLVYSRFGEISISASYETEEIRNKIQSEIDTVLRLNGNIDRVSRAIQDDTTTQIVKGRRNKFQSYDRILKAKYAEGSLTSEWIQEEIQNLTVPEEWDEFLGVKIFLLKQYL